MSHTTRYALAAMCHSVKVQMKLSLARPMFKFIIFLQPFLLSTIALLIYGRASASHVVNYVILGSGFTTLWSSIVFSSASDVNRERYYGTLETVFTAPASFAVVLTGKIIGNTALGFCSMLLSTVYLTALYQVPLRIPHPWLLGFSMVGSFLSLGVFAFFLAMAFTLSRQAEALMNFAEYPVYLVCGFLFPVNALPLWLHPLSFILPPTWSVELLRTSMATGNHWAQAYDQAGCLLASTLGYSALGLVCYRVLDYKARVIGKLGVY